MSEERGKVRPVRPRRSPEQPVEAGVTQEMVRGVEAVQLRGLGVDFATASQSYLDTVTEVAAGSSPDTAIPLLMLAVSQLLERGARLGAVQDVVPSERFEPDTGPEADVDPLRSALANLFEGLDEYADVVDTLVTPDLVRGRLSDDLTTVVSDLAHGLTHYRAGRVDEALWWWQYSYLSTWGVRAASALRVLQTMLYHLRFDVDTETAAHAQFEALHSTS